MSESSEDLFTKLESLNARNEQLLPDRPNVGCTHTDGDDLTMFPNNGPQRNNINNPDNDGVHRVVATEAASQPILSAPSPSCKPRPSFQRNSSQAPVASAVPHSHPRTSSHATVAPFAASPEDRISPPAAIVLSAPLLQHRGRLPAATLSAPQQVVPSQTGTTPAPAPCPNDTGVMPLPCNPVLSPNHALFSERRDTTVPQVRPSVTQRNTFARVLPQYSQRSIHMLPFLSVPEGAEPSAEDVQESPGRISGDMIPQNTPPITPQRTGSRIFPPARSPFAYRPANRTDRNSQTNPLPTGVSRPPPNARRGGIRGRGLRRRGGTPAPARKNNPATGWRVEKVPEESVISESEFLESYLTHRVRLFMISALRRLHIELDVRELSTGRADVLVLFIDKVLQSCRKWLNEFVRLRGIEGMDLSMSDMYKYLAVLLYSHCTRFSMKKVVSLLAADGGWAISKVLVTFIHGNILAYSPTGRGSDSAFTWNPQRDQTINLSKFERKSFRMSAKVYLNPNHTSCTLDDDLMGTRAEDNPIKTLSARKADGEGHSVTALADALFRVFLDARLSRRGETKKVAVRKLLSELLDNRGEKCLEGIVLTLDRGYATEEMVASLLDSRISCISIMKDVSVRGHPFVRRSYLTVGSHEVI